MAHVRHEEAEEWFPLTAWREQWRWYETTPLRLPPRREKRQEQKRWSGWTPLQLPQWREVLPRQQCLPW